jgi:L-lactate dehydrogenase complex protein LldG
MGSREKILENILRQPTGIKTLPALEQKFANDSYNIQKFCDVLESIGGKAVEVMNWKGLSEYLADRYPSMRRIISTIPDLPWYIPQFELDPHSFEDVDLCVLKGHFGVAENGAVWLTDGLMGDRSTPFISQHLAVVIDKNDIVPTLHEAYDRINSVSYDFGIFIAGPSKTADIEQSLVLGAHGPKSMTVFLLAR